MSQEMDLISRITGKTDKSGNGSNEPGNDAGSQGNESDKPNDETDELGTKPEAESGLESHLTETDKPAEQAEINENSFNLPSTATNLFNLLVIGLVIFAAGTVTNLIQKKRE
jgi:hypothetical protein